MELQEYEINNNQGQIMSLDYILLYLRRNFPNITIKSITPYSFTIGSNNNGENLYSDYALERSLFFGTLQICINPNASVLDDEKIEILYRSYFNGTPYMKRITRIVEKENLINEASYSSELFDSLSISQASIKYDFYLTFIGFKIDYN